MVTAEFVEVAATRLRQFLGEVLAPMFVDSFVRRVGNAERKGDASMVSVLDRKADAAFAELLPAIASLPVLSEEGDWQWPLSEDRYWIVDPLDGTHNFLLGTPLIGAAVTLVAAKHPVFAAVLLPLEQALGRCGLYIAAEGYGAYEWRVDAPRRLAVSRTARLADAFLLLEGSSHRIARADAAERLSRVTQRSRINLGAALSAALVACGAMNPLSADLVVTFGVKPWDSLPICLLVEQAGGRVTDHTGRPWSLMNAANVLASNGAVHDEALRVMEESGVSSISP